jgi:hypothetical protein
MEKAKAAGDPVCCGTCKLSSVAGAWFPPESKAAPRHRAKPVDEVDAEPEEERPRDESGRFVAHSESDDEAEDEDEDEEPARGRKSGHDET